MTKRYSVDKIDLLILYYLIQDAWLKDSQLAKKISVSKQVINYRIKKLTNAGYIRYYRTSTNSSLLGKRRYSILLRLKEGEDSTKVKNSLLEIPELSVVIECVGKWDLYISIWVAETLKVDAILMLISSKVKITKYTILQTVYSSTMFGRVLNPTNDHHTDQLDRKGISTKKQFSLSVMDKKILSILNRSKRDSLVAISNKLGSTYHTVKYKIKRLQELGFLQRFFAVLDMNKLGYQEWTCLCKVSLTKIEDLQNLLKYMDNRKEFSFYMRCIGEWDFYFSVFVKSPIEFKQIMHNILTKHKGLIEEYETFVIQQIY